VFLVCRCQSGTIGFSKKSYTDLPLGALWFSGWDFRNDIAYSGCSFAFNKAGDIAFIKQGHPPNGNTVVQFHIER